MVNQNKKIDKVLNTAKKIGVIGSPSSTSQLTLDILERAVKKKLVGELAMFNFSQEDKQHYALGQITEVELRNIWHEEPTMRSLIRQKGYVNPISERQDTHLGEMTVSAVFQGVADGKFQPSILGTIPATGTPITLVTDEVLDVLLETQKDEIFYLGNVYGSTPKLPTWFKHFGSGKGGAGEAYHIGIFGKTGSGKSVLAKMIMLAYARHKELGIFVIDPQGEFTQDIRGGTTTGAFKLPLKRVLKNKLQREVVVKGIRDLVLDRWDLFTNILVESKFFEMISIAHPNNRRMAAEEIERGIRDKAKLVDLTKRESFDKAWAVLGREGAQKIFYPSEGPRKRFQSVYEKISQEANRLNKLYSDVWKPIAELFNPSRSGSEKIDSLVGRAFQSETRRPVTVFDLSKESAEGIYWTEGIQFLVIQRLFDSLMKVGEWTFKQDKFLNSLVIIDEAHRLAPDYTPNIKEHLGVKHTLVDAVRTTRKYGLGWMFISQTLASLEKEIREQLRISFFGFGLSAGTEFRTLQELAGGDETALKLYRTFKDPHSAFDVKLREYAFMTMGPVSPLSFAGTPLFLSAFISPEVFLRENNLEV